MVACSSMSARSNDRIMGPTSACGKLRASNRLLIESRRNQWFPATSVRNGDLYGQSLPDLIVVSGELLKTATIILHSEGGDCKKLLLDPTIYLAEPSQDRASGGTPVRQLERKEKMRPIDGPRVLHPRVNLK